MTVLLTLPAYNEQDGLPKLLEVFCRTMEAAGLVHRLVICDDGSRDATREVIEAWSKRLPVALVAHEVNRGLGETIRDALRQAVELAHDDDVIVTMDADNTHPPELIVLMLQHIQRGSEIVIASRYRPGARVVGLSPFRRLLSWGARVLCQIVFPIPGVRDYTCGFRMYQTTTLRRAFATYGDQLISEQGFACMAELLVKISKLKVPISEVPLVLRYDQKGGASKMRVGRTVINTLKLLIRLRLG